MENTVIAQNTDEGPANASTLVPASPQLKLPIRRQRDAPQDLDIVSWPPHKRVPVLGEMPWYVYDVARGLDTYIYVIDNGINKDNAVRIQSLLYTLSFPDTALGIQIDAMAASA